MNKLIKKLTDDMKGKQVQLEERHYKDVIAYSDSDIEKEAFPKLVAIAISYLVEIADKDNEIRDLQVRLQECEKAYLDLLQEKQGSYGKGKLHKKQDRVYPADKNISFKTVKCLERMGIAKEQIAEQLGVSISTVYRKLREAAEQGFTGEEELGL